MHPSSASADLSRIANLAVLLRQNCVFIALFPAELGGTTTGTAGRTVCKSCTAHHKKSPDRMAWGSWWSIVHSTRTQHLFTGDGFGIVREVEIEHDPVVKDVDRVDKGINDPVSYTHLTLPTNREV